MAFTAVLCGAVALLAGCAGPVSGLFPPRAGEPTRTVYLVSHGWHTGIVLRTADLAPVRWPTRAHVSAFEFVEVGWGDRAFYQAPRGTSGLALRAALASGASVLHIVGLDGPPSDALPGSDVVELRLSAPGFLGLVAFIDAAHARDEAGRGVDVGPGLYGGGRFYLSAHRYHLLRTCNTWTAEALRAAGLPLVPGLLITADALMREAREAQADGDRR